MRATVFLLLATASCAAQAPAQEHAAHRPHAGAHGAHGAQAPKSDVDTRLAEVAFVHGGAGPWAVAGYRMGAFALTHFGVGRGSFDLEVVHYTPREVQYACIADGASAATGASAGKLNLTLADAPAPDTRTVYRSKSAGRTLTLRVTKAFAARFVDVPRDRLGEAGRAAMDLPDAEVFEVVP